jgi:hypothetical protein
VSTTPSADHPLYTGLPGPGHAAAAHEPVTGSASHPHRERRSPSHPSSHRASLNSPAWAQGDPRWGNAGADLRPSAAQIRTAVADEHCRQTVKYTGTLYSLMLAYEQPVIKAQRHVLQEINGLLEARLQNVLSLTAEP